MRLAYIVSQNRFFSFVTGSIALQAFVLVTAFYIGAYHPTKETHQISSSQSASLLSTQANTLNQNVPDPAAELKNERVVTYKVLSGDTLTKIWVKNGSTVSAAVSAAEAFRKAGIPLSSIRLNEELQLLIDKNGEIVELQKKLPEGKSLLLKGNSKDGYVATVNQAKIFENEKTISYPIFNSFSASAYEASVPNEIIDDLVDLFSGRLDFNRDLQPGDSFTVIYNERVTENGELLKPGTIRAISIENSGKLLVAMRHEDKQGAARYFDEKGHPLGNYFLRYPLRFTRISSVFSKSRFHPILQINRPHNGVDFAAPTGTPVRTVADGVIETAGHRGGSGIMVKIRHDQQYTTAYLHLSKIAAGLRVGSRVTRGDVIGAVGMTGLATAPHLHFSLYKNDKFVDPLTAKLPSAPPNGWNIPATYVAATLKTLRQQHDIVRLASMLGFSRHRAA